MSTDAQSMPTADAGGSTVSNGNRFVIPVMLVAAFIVILNETILAMALPHIMSDFRLDKVVAQWLSSAYMLTMAIVTPVSGFMIQRIHVRPLFLVAVILFGTGTLTAIIAPTFAILLIARVIQACGSAIMMPLLMTTVLILVPSGHRGRVMGNISIVVSVAPALGPTVAGIILQWMNWRWIFILVLPVTIAVIIGGSRLVKNFTTPRAVPIDLISVVLAMCGFGGIVFALSKISDPQAGVVMLVTLIVGGAGLLLFVARQLILQRVDSPLLDLRTLQVPTFTVAIAAVTVAFGSMIGVFILLPLYLQTVRATSTLVAGLIFLPGGLLMALMGPLVGRMYDRIGPRPLAIPGATIATAAMFGFSTIDTSTPILALIGLHVVLMFGLGMMFTPMFTRGLSALPANLHSHGSAMVSTLQQLAGAAGTALLVTLVSLGANQATANGATELEAQATGIQLGLFIAGTLSLCVLILVIFVGRNPNKSTNPARKSGSRQPRHRRNHRPE